MRRQKIAIIHPHLVEGGGSESPAVWTVEALKNEYEIYIITMGKIELENLNRFYGANLDPGQIKIISFPLPFYLKNRFLGLRGHRLYRFCKNAAYLFDLMICTYNIIDFRKKGIQFIADFSFDDRLRRAFDYSPKRLKRFFYKPTYFRKIYLRLGEILAGESANEWKRNLTITNSNWSGKIMKEVFDVETKTIYPPVIGEFPEIPWEKRENGFVYIGRLVPEKGVDRIISIMEEVRKRGFDVHLHILGGSKNLKYIRHLNDLRKRNWKWIFMEGTVYGEKKCELIAKHKFGINGRLNEPFGISVGEMIKGGCIVWAPNSGGQVEILNHNLLLYDNINDAVNKIDQVIKNNKVQVELQEHLANQSKILSPEKFMGEVKEVVDQFLNDNGKV